MKLSDILKINKGTRVIFLITFSVCAAAIVFAFFYYRGINRSEDPRITEARLHLIKFEKGNNVYNSFQAFTYLDSAYSIFNSLPDYRSSFETGIIYNNKCSTLLLKALYDSTLTESEKSALLGLSLKYCDSSISVYKGWINDWGNLSEEQISQKIKPLMSIEDKEFSGFDSEKIFNRRVKNLVLAQTETPRRLSVSFTNKGIIYRHLMNTDSALNCYNHALSLWKDNRTAKSNLSVLMGGEPLKPTLIESLFPPDKNKK
jgi:tetratricopeptide (TPR) repeat protein